MKNGYALITVLAVLIMIALGAATVLQSMGSITNVKSGNLQEVRGQYLAEAGMQYALAQCRTPGGCASVNGTTKDIDGTAVKITVPAPGQIKVCVPGPNEAC